MRSKLTGSMLNKLLGSVGIVTDKLTDIMIPFVPETASYATVRTAVAGGILLFLFSFVKGVLSVRSCAVFLC